MNAEIKTRIEMINKGEIPEGYKKTKVGIIPEDWEETRLEKDCKKINVGFVGTCEKYYTNKHKGIPMLRTGNIKDGKIKFKDLKYVTKEFHERNVKSQINRGDILIARHGSNGEGALYNYDNDANSLNIVIVRPDKDAINTNYLYYQINSSNTKRQVLARTAGSTQGVINTKEIKKIRIIRAKSKEQQKIAQILSTWDEVINLNEKLIEQKKEQKKGLMQKLLTGEVRLPGFDGEWEEVRLGRILKERKETGYSNLELLAITSDKGIVRRDEIDLKDTSSSDKSKYKRIMPLDIGYNTMRMWQGVSGVSEYEGIVSPAYTILKPTCKVDSYFMGYLFKIPEIINLFKRYSQGLVNDTLNLKYNNFKKIKVRIPKSLQEQKAIAQILSTADKEIDLLKEELEQLKLQKKGLMQLLLTGIIRVKS